MSTQPFLLALRATPTPSPVPTIIDLPLPSEADPVVAQIYFVDGETPRASFTRSAALATARQLVQAAQGWMVTP